jgi:hypothetical protein
MRAQARAQLTQHVYTFGIVRLPSLALAVSKAAALALALRPFACAALAGLALGHGLRWQSYFPALACCPGAGLLGLRFLPALPWPFSGLPGAFRCPSVLPYGWRLFVPLAAFSWLRLAGLAYHTAAAWRLPLLRLPWRYKDSASGFLGWLPALPFRRSWLAALPGFVLPLKKGGGLAGWLACRHIKNFASV